MWMPPCASAARAQKAWAKVPARKRGALVHALRRPAEGPCRGAGRLIALETGKALRTESRVEAGVVADVFEFFGGLGGELKGESVPFAPNVLSVTVREPLGVVGAIIPWNVPMLLMALKVAPALVAGNARGGEVGRGGAAGRAADLRADEPHPAARRVQHGLGLRAGMRRAAGGASAGRAR